MHRYNKLAIKTRWFNTAKIKYLFTPDELEMHQAIASVFEKFDTDGSGTLEISGSLFQYLDFRALFYVSEKQHRYNDERFTTVI